MGLWWSRPFSVSALVNNIGLPGLPISRSRSLWFPVNAFWQSAVCEKKHQLVWCGWWASRAAKTVNIWSHSSCLTKHLTCPEMKRGSWKLFMEVSRWQIHRSKWSFFQHAMLTLKICSRFGRFGGYLPCKDLSATSSWGNWTVVTPAPKRLGDCLKLGWRRNPTVEVVDPIILLG